jgi:hypothetical protein
LGPTSRWLVNQSSNQGPGVGFMKMTMQWPRRRRPMMLCSRVFCPSLCNPHLQPAWELPSAKTITVYRQLPKTQPACSVVRQRHLFCMPETPSRSAQRLILQPHGYGRGCIKLSKQRQTIILPRMPGCCRLQASRGQVGHHDCRQTFVPAAEEAWTKNLQVSDPTMQLMA